MKTSEEFWNRVNQTDTCWLWTGAVRTDGYGHCRYQGNQVSCHRLAWTLTYGEIPIGLCVLHKCDVRLCINPDHLYLGTKKDNSRDAIVRGRWKPFQGEAHGSSKIDEVAVRLIFGLSKTGLTHEEIGEQVGLKRGMIGNILRREAWKHVSL